MASKKRKNKRKRTRSKISAAKRVKRVSRAKQAVKSKPAKKAVKKKHAKASSRRSVARRKTVRDDAQALGFSLGRHDSVSGLQSGDLQGLSQAEQADSESVDELVEEGNLFEAGAVAGVEEADNADEREVHTHEVPEDDVPEEYLDKD